MDNVREASGRIKLRYPSQDLPKTYDDDASLVERLALELLAVCLGSCQSYGVDRKRVLAALQSADRTAAQAPLARRLFQDTHWLGELANVWSAEEQYLDASHHPLPLRTLGAAPSFSALVRRFFPGRAVGEVLEFALATGVVMRRGRGRVALRERCVMLTGRPVLLLARAVLCVRGLLAATENNGLKAGRRRSLSPDRLACAVVTKEKFEQFATLMRPQLYNVVETGNRWLSDYAVRDRPMERADSNVMGVHAYVFSD